MGDLSLEKLLLFAIFAMPGAIAVRVYSLWFPTQHRDWKESIVDAVLYSSLILAIWFIFAPTVVKRIANETTERDKNISAKIDSTVFPVSISISANLPEQNLATFNSRSYLVNMIDKNGFYLFLYIFISPVLITLFWYWLRMYKLHSWFGIDHPERTSWDWAFKRSTPYVITITLKNKRPDPQDNVLMGFFGSNSYVTTYPHDPEIYLETGFKMNKETGCRQLIEDGKGFFIRLSECEFIEFSDAGISLPKSWIHRIISQVGQRISALFKRLGHG